VTTLDIICAWCKKKIGEKESPLEIPPGAERITHSICTDCAEIVQGQIQKYPQVIHPA